MCVRPKLRLLIPIPSPQSRTFFPAFRHGFAAVAGVAKALQILPVREHRPVPVVRDDVVHLRGPGSAARISWRIPNRTLPAKRLSQELSGAQIVCPFRRGVHPAPGSGRLAAACSVFGLMRCAVSARHQGAASWVSARPQGLLCHRAITSGQNKRACADTSRNLRFMWHRHSGTGTGQYSRWPPCHRPCRIPRHLWFVSLAEVSLHGPFHIQGK